MQLVTLGNHEGAPRRLARGLRLTCRPYVERWGNEYETPEDAIRRSARLLSHWIPTADAITWVPGHDGTPGPGHPLAEALGALIHSPVAQLLVRATSLPSAHAAADRPSVLESKLSLEGVPCRKPTRPRVLLVDNVVATGATLAGAALVLDELGYNVSAAAVSIDLSLAMPRLNKAKSKSQASAWFSLATNR
jgi:hypothetical protein